MLNKIVNRTLRGQIRIWDTNSTLTLVSIFGCGTSFILVATGLYIHDTVISIAGAIISLGLLRVAYAMGK